MSGAKDPADAQTTNKIALGHIWTYNLDFDLIEGVMKSLISGGDDLSDAPSGETSLLEIARFLISKNL